MKQTETKQFQKSFATVFEQNAQAARPERFILAETDIFKAV